MFIAQKQGRAIGPAVGIFGLSVFFSLPYALQVAEAMPSDVAEYEELALNLVHGRGYVVKDHFRCYRTPGLPLFLAAIYGVWGDQNYPIVRVIQTGMFAIGNVLLFRLGWRLGGTRLGLIAGLVGAMSHELVFWAAKPASEFLYTFLLLCATVTLVEAVVCRSKPWACGAGLLAGASFLTRPISLVIVVFWAVALLVFRRTTSFHFSSDQATPRAGDQEQGVDGAGGDGSFRARLGLAACLLACFWVVALPWYVRNFMLYQRVFTDSHAGLAIWHGNHPSATVGGWYGIVWPTPSARTLIEEHGMNEVEVSDHLTREAIGFMRERPWHTVKLAAGRIGFMLVGSTELLTNVPFDHLWIWPGMQVELVKYSWPMFLLTLVGLFTTVSRREPLWWVLYVILAGSIAVHAIYAAVPRMRVPLMPALYLCAARGIWLMADYFLSGHWHGEKRTDLN